MGIKSKEIEKSMTITDIVKEIFEIDIADSSECEYEESIANICDKLTEFYNKEGRHSYSEVSTLLLSINEDKHAYFYDNMKSILKILDENDKKNNTKFKSKAIKLEDHIKLELLRVSNIKKVDQLKEKIDNETVTYENKFKELRNVYSKQKEDIDGLNSQIISVIGIFSAIVITFFGGINFIESVLNSINKVSKYRLVFAILITGFVMFNTIFMLLNFISKLTGKNIRSSCDNYIGENKCAPDCKNRKNIKCIKSKHPTIYWVNAIFMVGIIGITLMYYLDYFDILTKILNN